jgi:hypothetical protein
VEGTVTFHCSSKSTAIVSARRVRGPIVAGCALRARAAGLLGVVSARPATGAQAAP